MRARSLGLAGLVVGALAAPGCATPDAQPAPGPSAAAPQPVDVRVAELSPADVERIADAVAARLAASRPAPAAPPEFGRPQAIRAAGPAASPRTSRAEEVVAAPRIPAPTAADVASLREGVDLALGWLARHQSPSGGWSAAGFAQQCRTNRCLGDGDPAYDVGVTGLALLCFVRAGHLRADSPHAEVVRRAFAYLRDVQDRDGCLGTRRSRHFLYDHGYAALALVEGYGASRSDDLRARAQKAVDFVESARNPYLGWRYGVRDGDNDTSVTSLMTHVLASARDAGLKVDPESFRGAVQWVEKMTDPELGRVGYQQRGGPPARTMEAMQRFPADRVETLTAAGLTVRQHAGDDAAPSGLLAKGAALLSAKPPRWDADGGAVDLVYWYWGTLAMSRRGGEPWDQWRAYLFRALSPSQRRDAGRDELGSWDAVDAWSAEGGRVYTTATACLAAQIALTR